MTGLLGMCQLALVLLLDQGVYFRHRSSWPFSVARLYVELLLRCFQIGGHGARLLGELG